MTTSEFTQWLDCIHTRPSQYRVGQHLFNNLYDICPDIANAISGTKYDCFYRDSDRIIYCISHVYSTYVLGEDDGVQSIPSS